MLMNKVKLGLGLGLGLGSLIMLGLRKNKSLSNEIIDFIDKMESIS